jgi:hypothetical protein
MVKMAVGQQDTVETSEAGPAAQQLALCPLAAVHQNAMATGLDQEARVVAIC